MSQGRSIVVAGTEIFPCDNRNNCRYYVKSRHVHYHCICGATVQRLERMVSHTKKHEKHSLLIQQEASSRCGIDDGQLEDSVDIGIDAVAPVTAPSTSEDVPGLGQCKRYRTKCAICDKVMLKKNVNKHMQRIHGTQQCKPLSCIQVDKKFGIFMCAKNAQGNQYPVHLIVRVSASTQEIVCTDADCQEASHIAERGDFASFQCPHVTSAAFAIVPTDDPQLSVDVLERVVQEKILKASNVISVTSLNDKAVANGSPAVVWWQQSLAHDVVYLSVYSHDINYYSRTGRVIVQFNTKSSQFDCACCTRKSGCVHKKLALWYIAQFKPELIKNADSADGVVDTAFVSDVSDADTEPYVVKLSDSVVTQSELGSMEQEMSYARTKYAIPINLKFVVVSAGLTALEPPETLCPNCNAVLIRFTVTESGKIYDTDRIISGVCVRNKWCQQCNRVLRYELQTEGIHNYDNKTFITMRLALFLRSAVKKHTAIARALEILGDCYGLKFPTNIHSAYLHFEAMTNHTYDFSCLTCGHYPTVVILDGNRKCAFKVNVDSLQPPDNTDNADHVNMFDFWTNVENEMLLTGYPEANACKSKRVVPNYNQWSPWLAPATIAGDMVYNTEYKKCPTFQDGSFQSLDEEKELSEEFLIELLCESDLKRVKEVAGKAGISCNGTKLDIISRMQASLKDTSLFRKIFTTLWGSSGGIVTASCPHGVVYALKVVIRAESVRDHVDILLSMKHTPNLIINDMPGMTAKHGNIRKSNMFNPYDGRFAENTEENLEKLKHGLLEVTLGLFDTRSCTAENEDSERSKSNGSVHPISKSSHVYCAADRFHFKNIKTESDKLRNINIVTDLRGKINSQVSEQLFSVLRKDVYFLNNLSPEKFLFMLRLILHFRNTEITDKQRQSAERLLSSTGVSLAVAEDGRMNCSVNDNSFVQTVASEYTETIDGGSLHVDEQVAAGQNQSDLTDSCALKQRTPRVCQLKFEEVLETFAAAVREPRSDCHFVDEFSNIITASCTILQSSSDEELKNAINNINHTAQLISQSVSVNRRNEIRTVVGPNGISMQTQGVTNYCGMCCINNLLGTDDKGIYPFTVDEMDSIADRLWLDLLSVGITCNLTPLRSVEGFYNYDVLQKCLNSKGYNLVPINCELFGACSPAEFRLQLIDVNEPTTKLLLRLPDHEHFIAVNITNDVMYLYDSSKASVDVLDIVDGVHYLLTQLRQMTSTSNGILCLLQQTGVVTGGTANVSPNSNSVVRELLDDAGGATVNAINLSNYVETRQPSGATEKTQKIVNVKEKFGAGSYKGRPRTTIHKLRRNPTKKRYSSSWWVPPAIKVKHTKKLLILTENKPENKRIDRACIDTVSSSSSDESTSDMKSTCMTLRQFNTSKRIERAKQRLQDQKAIWQQKAIAALQSSLKLYNLYTDAPFNHEVCSGYDLLNYVCFGSVLPPSSDVIRWSKYHTDYYSGQTFGLSEYKHLICIVFSADIETLDYLFTVLVHEVGHAYNIVSGARGRPHGPEFHRVISSMVRSIRPYLAHFERIFSTSLKLDRKYIQRTRAPRKKSGNKCCPV